MSETEKRVFSEKEMNSVLIILYVLIFANIVYIFLLFMLDMTATNLTGSKSNLTESLFLAFILLAIIDIGLAFRVFIPRALTSENPYTAFPLFLIPIILCETSGIFGLVLGILQLNHDFIHVNWVEVLGFFLLSIASMYWMVENQIKPHLRKCIGIEFEYPYTNNTR